jgi:endonuclease/exonuclease/phosphatase family metal-dependent hydrolase
MRSLVIAGSLAVAACGPEAATSPDARGADASASADAAVDVDVLKVMTFNIKSGRESSLEAIADVINAERPEIVALQEVDVDTVRTGMVNQPHRLGQLTGMTNLFRTAIPYDGGAYGLCVLSEHPILSSTSLQLTSVGEQRILITVEIEIDPGRVITIADTHFGLDADARVTQANEVIAAIGADPDVLLFGDFNDEPGTPPIDRMVTTFQDAWDLSGEGDGFTIPVTTPTRRIDYIWLGDNWSAPLDIRVIDTQASDHLPVVAVLPRQ